MVESCWAQKGLAAVPELCADKDPTETREQTSVPLNFLVEVTLQMSHLHFDKLCGTRNCQLSGGCQCQQNEGQGNGGVVWILDHHSCEDQLWLGTASKALTDTGPFTLMLLMVTLSGSYLY